MFFPFFFAVMFGDIGAPAAAQMDALQMDCGSDREWGWL